MQASIAIIGLSFELAGIKNWKELVASLTDNNTYIGGLPPSRARDMQQRYGDMEMADGGFLSAIDQFDNKYFNLSGREALRMTPEHRLFLTHALKAFYDAGYTEEELKGSSTGIFYTASKSAYRNFYTESLGEFDGLEGMEGTRLANFLDLRGPVLSLNTSCSSSLAAVNNAILSLNARECEKALVGGVRISVIARESAIKSTVVSQKQSCKPFDDEADGLMNGEGVVCIILKRLKDAERDGDPIYGVIKGSAINHGGARISSLTAPSSEAQKEVLLKAWQNAEVSPASIRFIEAHGTGTILGDPIEFTGIKEAFLEQGLSDSPCSISSFKGQVGHLDTLSGAAGLVRLVAALNRKTLPVQANFASLNKYIDDKGCGINVQQEPEEWKSISGERIGGVSSFGLTGTNVHMVIAKKEEEEKQDKHIDWLYLQLGEESGEKLNRLKKMIAAKLDQLTPAQKEIFCQKVNRVFQLKKINQGFVLPANEPVTDQLNREYVAASENRLFYILDLEILAYDRKEITAILRENKLLQAQWDKLVAHTIGSIPDDTVLAVLFQFVIYKYLTVCLGDKIKFITRKGTGALEQLMNNKISAAQMIADPEKCTTSGEAFDEEAFGAYLERSNNATTKITIIDFSGKDVERFNHLSLDLLTINGSFSSFNRFSLYAEILKTEVNPLKSGINPLVYDLEFPYFEPVRFWPEVKQAMVAEVKQTAVPAKPKFELADIKRIMRQVWCEVLEIEELEETDDFFDVLGGTSLTALDMLGDLENKIPGIKFSYEEMYKYSTMEVLSNVIYEQLNKATPVATKENSSQPSPQEKRNDYAQLIGKLGEEKVMTERPGNILVTGATGLIGSFLVDYLFNNTSAVIYCLVRGEDAYKRLWHVLNENFNIEENDRIRVVTGDLELAGLGLAPDALPGKIDAVYHVAGSPAFVSKLQPEEHINFTGTKNCSDWAVKNKVPDFNFISTVGVTGKTMPQQVEDFYETDLNVGQDAGSLIHASSKLLAEEYLKNNFSGNLKVFRVSNVGGRYQDGAISSDLSKNLMYLKLKYMYELGCFSEEIGDYNSSINLMPLDVIASLIAELSFTRNSSLSTYHLNLGKAFSVREIFDAFKKNGQPIQKLAHADFLDYFEKFRQGTDNYGLNLFKVGKDQAPSERKFQFHNEATVKLIDKLGVPAVNEYDRLQYLDKVVHYFFKTMSTVQPPAVTQAV